MPNLLIPIGLPGAGKTHDRPDGYLVVCKDDVRFSLFNYPKTGKDFDDELEPAVDRATKELFLALLPLGKDIYVDECNLTERVREFYVNEGLKLGYDVVLRFYPNYSEAIRRNAKRERKVPFDVISRMVDEMEFPTVEEKKVCEVVVAS